MAEIRTSGVKVSVNAKLVGEFQSIGSIKQKRAVKEYASINTDTVVQALGNITVDPIPVSVLYDPTDALGAGELESAFNTGTPTPFEVELNNSLGVNGTKYAWTGAVISDFELTPDQDGLMLASFTIALNGKPTVTPAA